MKKILLLVVGAFLLSTSLWAKTIVPLSVNIEENDQPGGNGMAEPPCARPWSTSRTTL